MPESLTTVIQPIAEDILQGRLAAFCGAGISINSGLASADTLIRDVLRLLDVDEDVVEDIRASGETRQ
jgi:S-adenosylmethionine synthetase